LLVEFNDSLDFHGLGHFAIETLLDRTVVLVELRSEDREVLHEPRVLSLEALDSALGHRERLRQPLVVMERGFKFILQRLAGGFRFRASLLDRAEVLLQHRHLASFRLQSGCQFLPHLALMARLQRQIAQLVLSLHELSLLCRLVAPELLG
jgi:hypothetical protein